MIDGCHVKFHPPMQNQLANRNYKKFHSFVLMATVLPDRTFPYVFSGFPCSSHDSYIFQRSPLFKKLDTDCRELYDPNRYHIIGDSAFPLMPSLLVP